MATHMLSRPIRVGVFSAIDRAEAAVRRLLSLGFTKDDITVMSTNREFEAHFREYEHQEPAGYYTPMAVATGAVCGAAAGALASAVAIPWAGEFGTVAMACILISFGAVAGGLISAMMTRGAERELSNFYNQAVPDGAILVAAEAHGEHPEKLLTDAEFALAEEGAEPLELAEG